MSQSLLDDQMRADARRRQRREGELNPASETKAGRTLITAVLSGESALAQAVEQMMTTTTPTRGARGGAFLATTGLSATVIAHLTLRALVDMLGPMSETGDMSRTSCCIGIANRVHEEWRLAFFDQAPNRAALLDKVLRDLATRQVKRDRVRQTLQPYFKAEQVSWQGWTQSEKIIIGAALLYAVRDTTGLFALNDKARVEPADALTDALRKLSAAQSMTYVRHLPRLDPPLPWTPDNLFAGAYDGDLATPLIKASGRRDAARLIAADWSKVLPAVNAIQATAWRVNRRMVEAVDWTFATLASQDHYVELGKLPRSEPKPPQPYPASTDPDVLARYRHSCFKTHERNRLDRAPRSRAEFTLQIARQFRDAPAIYFPHACDTRGRCYPIPSFLNPQGADYSRAMLEFAEGRALDTPAAILWFKIAGANAWGFDKAPLADRATWTDQNENLIFGCAADFRTDRRWTEAAKPFSFLAFCLEYEAWQRDPDAFRSHLPVAVDATCSGLQHYAGLLLDADLGARVNLLPSAKRGDVYADVAEIVKRTCLGHAWGQDWISFGIDRATVKPMVMTVPYSLTRRGCRLQLWRWLDTRLEAGYALPWPCATAAERAEHKARVLWLDEVIWTSIAETVAPAKAAMAWLTILAKAWSKEQNKIIAANPAHDPYAMAMTWATPDGFPVITYREQEKLRQVETRLNGNLRVQLRFYEGKHRLSSPKMGNSIAPNFIHGLDATLLRMAVRKGAERGMDAWGVTHDAFALPAPIVADFLAHCVKPAFAELYDADLLAAFGHHFAGLVEPPPARGSLDLTRIAGSEFFFS